MEILDKSQDVDIRDYLSAIRQRAWLVVLLSVAAALATYLLMGAQTPLYEANAELLVVGGASEAADAQLNDIQVGERLALSFVERLSNREVLDQAIRNLDLDLTVEELREELEINPVGRTQLIELTVRDPSPVTARDLANEIPSAFVERNRIQQIERFTDARLRVEDELSDISLEISDLTAAVDELENDPAASQEEILRANAELMRLRDTYSGLLRSYEELRVAEMDRQNSIIVDEAAVIPTEPVWPNVLVNTILAGILGALLGVTIIVIAEFFDNSLKTPDDVQKTTGLATLAGIPQYPVKRGQDYELIVLVQPRSHVSEAFRGLRTAITYSNVDRITKSLLITSANPSEGKSITTANLGVAMAQAGNRVLIVDADLRKPMQHKILELTTNRNGLTNVLVQMQILDQDTDTAARLRTIIENSVQVTRQKNLFVLSSGVLPPNPAELVGSEKMRKLIDLMSEAFDMVLIDSPPVLAVTDAAVISTRVDDVILVCSAGETRQNHLQQAVLRLAEVKSTPVGVVLNKVATKKGSYYQYSDRYHREKTSLAHQ